MNFDGIKLQLLESGFTDKEFRELKAICDVRLGNFSDRASVLSELGSKSKSTEAYTVAFYNQIKIHLELRCKIPAVPLSLLRKTSPRVYSDVVKCASALFTIAQDWNPSERQLRRNFVAGVYHLYARLIVDYLQRVKVPVSVKTVVQHADKFVGIVDQAYPGYITGGAINMVVVGAFPTQ